MDNIQQGRQSIVKTWLLSAMLLLGSFATSVSATTPENYHQVSAELYRSSQPSAAQMQTLEQQGIKTVLSLRQWNDDDSEARGTGLILRRVAINAAVINDDVVVRALREIRFAQKPVLIHCWHGSDRTGLVVAMYRLVFENADKPVALAELRKPEHGYHENYYAGIARYIGDADVGKIRQRVFADSPVLH